MSTPDTETAAPPLAPDAPIPAIRTPLAQDDILQRLRKLSKNGKLPGYEKGTGGELFSVAAHGTPFDKTLLADAKDGGTEGGTTLQFRATFSRKLLLILIVGSLALIEPGGYFTDEFIATWIPALWKADWYPATWMWYYPLTIVSVVWAWFKVARQVNTTTREHIEKTLPKLAKAIDGTIEPAV